MAITRIDMTCWDTTARGMTFMDWIAGGLGAMGTTCWGGTATATIATETSIIV
jgi:hypothetical protein